MDFSLEPASIEDREAIIDIYNHYVENSFAAYPEDRITYEFFSRFLSMAEGYPFLVAKNSEGRALGFAMLRPHNPTPTFSRTADITYFIAPEHTNQGIGKAMQTRLISHAREKGITTILASISSLNTRSLDFHKKQGFQECGRFQKIGRKWGQDFDVIWMQKMV